MKIGVFSCDPGGHTGLAWGIFDPSHPTSVDEMLRGRLNADGATIDGSPASQIRKIVMEWHRFTSACWRQGVPSSRVWFVMEEFILKPGETAGGSDSTSPLCIIWGIKGFLMGADSLRRGVDDSPGVIMQMAGEAKAYGTGARLKEWGIWVKGREHERSAWSHIAFFLKKYLIQDLG